MDKWIERKSIFILILLSSSVMNLYYIFCSMAHLALLLVMGEEMKVLKSTSQKSRAEILNSSIDGLGMPLKLYMSFIFTIIIKTDIPIFNFCDII